MTPSCSCVTPCPTLSVKSGCRALIEPVGQIDSCHFGKRNTVWTVWRLKIIQESSELKRHLVKDITSDSACRQTSTCNTKATSSTPTSIAETEGTRQENRWSYRAWDPGILYPNKDPDGPDLLAGVKPPLSRGLNPVPKPCLFEGPDS